MAIASITTAALLCGCATASDDLPAVGPRSDSGATHADTTPPPVVDAFTPTFDSSLDTATPADDGTFVFDSGTTSADSGTIDSFVAVDSDVVVDSGVASDSGADAIVDDSTGTDTLVATDTLVSGDGGCGSPVAPGPGEGTTCTAAIPIDVGLACTQTFVGDTCSGATVASSCGSGQAFIYALSVSSGTVLYSIGVDSGFSLAAIPGPPLCGGPGTCVGSGMATGVSKGTTQYWTVMKVGGGCGTYTITVTPS